MNWFKSFWKSLTTPPAPTKMYLPAHAARPVADEPVSNFTPRSQEALALARREARRLQHNFVGTEHLLLGILALGQGTAMAVFKKMGLEPATIRSEIERQAGVGTDEKVIGNIPYTPRVKKVLALAAKESRALNHSHVGTEHILLGFLREGDGMAGRVLTRFGLDLERARQQVRMEVDPNYRPSPDAPIGSAPTISLGPAGPRTQPAAPAPKVREPLDTNKRYDVYCGNRAEETVYRNAVFKGVKTLFQKGEYDAFSQFFELEQSDGKTIFIARSSVVKFCEHVPPPEPPPS